MLNKKFIINILGLVLVFEALFMLICALVAFFYDEGDTMALTYSGLIALIFMVFSCTQEEAPVGISNEAFSYDYNGKNHNNGRKTFQ